MKTCQPIAMPGPHVDDNLNIYFKEITRQQGKCIKCVQNKNLMVLKKITEFFFRCDNGILVAYF